MSETDLSSFDVDDIKLETLLFQTGYLTIKEVKRRFNQETFRLGYPNLEVRTAFNERIYRYLLTDNANQNGKALQQIKDKKYLNIAKEVIIIGIEFSKEEKNICKFEWERVK
jgi:hypothetical protein